jgi:hypothetical protein
MELGVGIMSLQLYLMLTNCPQNVIFWRWMRRTRAHWYAYTRRMEERWNITPTYTRQMLQPHKDAELYNINGNNIVAQKRYIES